MVSNMNDRAVLGQGDPNKEDGEYEQAVGDTGRCG